MLLALDPSSTTTGWALFDGPKCIRSGFIDARIEGQFWDGILAKAIRDLVEMELTPFGDPLTVLLEDVSNRSNKRKGRARTIHPNQFQWAKAVGVCFGTLDGLVTWKRYPSNWLVGKPYAPNELARHHKFRIQCAQAHRPEVVEVNEATAVLFGVWYQTADPRLFEWKPPAPRKPRRRDGKLNLEPRTPSPGSTQTAQPVVATSVALPKRPGRRI